MLIAGSRCESPGSDTACSVNLQYLALLWLQNIGGRFQPQLFDGLPEDFLRRGVNQEAIIEHYAQWIVPDDEPDGVILIQNRKHKRTLDLFSHKFQAVEVEGFLLFKKLYRNVTIRFNTRHRQILFHTEFFVIPQYAVMRESKAVAVNVNKERVIILVKLCIALCCHAGMTHDNIHVVGQVDLHLPSGQGTLVDAQTVVEVVRDAGRIRAANLTLSCESVQDFVLRMGAETLLKVD